jgi:hypothetical protein
VHDLLHELVAEHFGLDTKVARTVVTLVRRPGRLTQEFLAGRRARYLSPLRLYLSLSVLFFLCSAISARVGGSTGAGIVRFNTSGTRNKSGTIISFDTTALQQDAAIPVANPVLNTVNDSTDITRNANAGIVIDTLHGNPFLLPLQRRIDRRAAYMQSHRAEAATRVSEAFQHDLPDALFLLVPGLAFALWILYHSSHLYFAEHLIFALHFQAFSFLALTVGLLPIPFLDTITGVAILVYLFVALRRVYVQSIASTAGRFAAIVMGYGISLAVIMGAVALTVFLFA